MLEELKEVADELSMKSIITSAIIFDLIIMIIAIITL